MQSELLKVLVFESFVLQSDEVNKVLKALLFARKELVLNQNAVNYRGEACEGMEPEAPASFSESFNDFEALFAQKQESGLDIVVEHK